jgi:hypothetical protein
MPLSSYSTATHQHQQHALFLFYDRLPKLVVFPVMTALCIPLVFQIINTGGHAHLFITLTLSFLWWLNQALRYYANDTAEYHKGQVRNMVRIPIMAAVLSSIMVYFFRSMTGNYFACYLSSVQLFGTFIRIACAVGLLELGVLLRYSKYLCRMHYGHHFFTHVFPHSLCFLNSIVGTLSISKYRTMCIERSL